MNECWTQAELGDAAGWVPDHCTKLNIAVKQAAQIIWFPCARQHYVHSLLYTVKCTIALCLKHKVHSSIKNKAAGKKTHKKQNRLPHCRVATNLQFVKNKKQKHSICKALRMSLLSAWKGERHPEEQRDTCMGPREVHSRRVWSQRLAVCLLSLPLQSRCLWVALGGGGSCWL